jgi:UDP-N-acetylglucosamine--N-acetylmuramyl-(pentapeptide) pyrophosphoryl-undecaprenol N-acetylglucosamine transferase
VPALALADVLSGRGHQVAFCGTERGMEKHLVPKAGYDLSTVRIRGFERRLGVSTLQTLAYIPLAAMDAYRVLRDTRPECVV